jgi:hypothetical protein
MRWAWLRNTSKLATPLPDNTRRSSPKWFNNRSMS